METINHEYYVSLDVAKLLEAAGFDWDCKDKFYDFTNACKIYKKPTINIVQKWVRDIKNIAVYICPVYEPIGNDVNDKWIMKWQVAALHCDIESDEIDLGDVAKKIFDTYEEALESGEKKVFEIILNNNEI